MVLHNLLVNQCIGLNQCTFSPSGSAGSVLSKIEVSYQCIHTEELFGSTCLSVLPENFRMKLIPDSSLNVIEYPSTLGRIVIAFQASEKWEMCTESNTSDFIGLITLDDRQKDFVVPPFGKFQTIDFGVAPPQSLEMVLRLFFCFSYTNRTNKIFSHQFIF